MTLKESLFDGQMVKNHDKNDYHDHEKLVFLSELATASCDR